MPWWFSLSLSLWFIKTLLSFAGIVIGLDLICICGSIYHTFAQFIIMVVFSFYFYWGILCVCVCVFLKQRRRETFLQNLVNLSKRAIALSKYGMGASCNCCLEGWCANLPSPFFHLADHLVLHHFGNGYSWKENVACLQVVAGLLITKGCCYSSSCMCALVE